MMQKLGESKEYFSLSFMNQDIYYAELEEISTDNAFLETLGIVDSLLKKHIGRELFAVHLDGTKVTKKISEALVVFIESNIEKFKKLVVVGLHGCDRITFSLKLRKRIYRKLMWKIENNYQNAKEWLISKNQ